MKAGDDTRTFMTAAATSADMFAAAAALRAAGIRMPPRAWAAASLGGAVILFVSAYAASAAGVLLSPDITAGASRLLLFIMGIYMILSGYIPSKKNDRSIISRPENADSDGSKSISLKEAISMGLALSADSVFTGAAAGAAGMSPERIFLWSLLTGFAACFLGTAAGGLLGKKLAGKLSPSAAGGAVLIILSFMG